MAPDQSRDGGCSAAKSANLTLDEPQLMARTASLVDISKLTVIEANGKGETHEVRFS